MRDDVTPGETMTTEIASPLSPSEVLASARTFFLGEFRMADGWIETESDAHITFCTFRGNLSVAAYRDAEAPDETRIRVTTLREEGIVPRLMAHLGLEGAAR